MTRTGCRLRHSEFRHLLGLDPQTRIEHVDFDRADGSIRVFLSGPTLPVGPAAEDSFTLFHDLETIRDHQITRESLRYEAEHRAEHGVFG